MNIEDQFVTFEVKTPDGRVTGYMIKCKTCGEKKTFELGTKTTGTKVTKFLAKHEHLVLLAN